MKNIFKNIIRDQFHATENHNSEEYKTRSDMFGILLSTYLEHTEGLSEEQRTLILSEIEKMK